MSSIPINIFSTTEERVSAIEQDLMISNRKINLLQESEMKLEEEVRSLKEIIQEMKDEKEQDKKLINPTNHISSYKLEID